MPIPQTIEIPIKMLTPIWTGDISGRSTNLKMSGVMGGLRQAFETLVRKHGGHTCNITGSDSSKKCNYERDRNVCPACLIFGCTGLSRVFRTAISLSQEPCLVPETDPIIHNRPHYTVSEYKRLEGRDQDRLQVVGKHVEYKYPCSIDTWLAAVADLQINGRMPRLTEHNVAQNYLRNNVKVSFSKDPICIKITPLRSTTADLAPIFRYLLLFLSKYWGIGAKVRQGWGMFELQDAIDPGEIEREGTKAIERLIENSGFRHTDWDTGLPNAAHCFCAEWELQSQSPKLGLKWPQVINYQARPYLATGFALTYRLRRFVKFYEVDRGANTIPGIASDWRKIGSRLNRGPWRRCPWKDTLPFVRAIFGRDGAGEQNKISGLVGTSHLFKKNDKWHVRFFGHIPNNYRYLDSNPPQNLRWDADDVRDFLVYSMSCMLNGATMLNMDINS